MPQALYIPLILLLLGGWILLGQKKYRPQGILALKVGHATLIALLTLGFLIRLSIRDPHFPDAQGFWPLVRATLIYAALVCAVILHAKYWPTGKIDK